MMTKTLALILTVACVSAGTANAQPALPDWSGAWQDVQRTSLAASRMSSASAICFARAVARVATGRCE